MTPHDPGPAPAPQGAAGLSEFTRRGAGSAPAPTRSRRGKRVVLLLVMAAAGAGLYYYRAALPAVMEEAKVYLAEQVLGRTRPVPKDLEPPPASTPENGAVEVTESQASAIGLGLTKVLPQVDPIKLELTGRTAYDPNSLYRVRPRFDTLVEKVFAELGQLVHKGDPLVDLHSADLAAAKNEVQAKYVQWQRDLRVLELDDKLAGEGARSRQTVIDDKNAENKSRLEYLTTRDKLRVLGVPDEDVEPLIQQISDNPSLDHDTAAIRDKAKMTLRSRFDGIVIQRDVVQGNFFDDLDVLMVIAPLDHLWVLANVYEVDQAKVTLNQKLEIQFPYLQLSLSGTVEFVSSEVSRETRAVQIRASIPNSDGKLKSDMLVKVILDVPPGVGQTHIPRASLVSINGVAYVYVKDEAASMKGRERFHRRAVRVAQEHTDFVVVASGLKAGETVAAGGSLILAQLYEDAEMVATGLPVP